MENRKTAIGLMSGTSLDGIDAALIESDGHNYLKTIASHHIAYSIEFRSLLKQSLQDALSISSPKERPGNLRGIERELTLKHADAVKALLEKAKYKASDIDLLGFHGQTVLHRPPQASSSNLVNNRSFTVQIGDGALLAKQTHIATIADMRSNDMLHGGNGAPLVPVFHRALAYKLQNTHRLPILFINIGGISNGTYVGNLNEQGTALFAADYGPGNALIDQWAELHTGQSYDDHGQAGLNGQVLKWLKKAYLDQPIFAAKRRSFDRLDFPSLDEFLQNYASQSVSYEDGAATLAAITAECIAKACLAYANPAKTLVVSGGGSKNCAIMNMLGKSLSSRGIKLFVAEDLGLDSVYMEAESWGYLAIRSSYNLPLTYPTTTGCQKPVSGGVLFKP